MMGIVTPASIKAFGKQFAAAVRRALELTRDTHSVSARSKPCLLSSVATTAWDGEIVKEYA